MSTLEMFRKWFEVNQTAILEDYFQFLKIASVSSEEKYKKDVLQCSAWVRKYLEDSGLIAEEVKTVRYPVVFAENKDKNPKKPTVLIYGHYDVQPVDTLDEWKSDPFTPTQREGKIFARGAVDDKGQILYAMLAMRAIHQMGKKLPVNVKFCIEGEEEDGSLGLTSSLKTMKEKWKADYLLVVDFDGYDEVTPAISLGARGMLSMDVTLSASNSDLHSGSFGGIAYNPNRALAELLSKLYDKNGRVAVDGFYDDVKEPSSEEKSQFPERHNQEYYRKTFGIEAFSGEKGRSLHESNVFFPVLEINGMAGGYFGPGFKTVIPRKAIAKISCRLVMGQNPQKIGKQIETFLKKHCVPGMELTVNLHPGSSAYRGSAKSKLAIAVEAASTEVMGRPCQKVLTGASIPVVASLSQAIQAEVVGMGYGLPSDQIHAPNEHFDMRRFEHGFLTVSGALMRL